MFLRKKFPHAKLTWQEHIQHSVIYCLVHYDRATRKAIGKKHIYLAKYLELPHLQTKLEVEALIAMGKKDPKARGKRSLDALYQQCLYYVLTSIGWAKHRKCPWVLSGLNVNYTKMDPVIFENQRRHTNVGESVHRKTNQVGVRQSLLSAVLTYVNLSIYIVGTTYIHCIN